MPFCAGEERKTALSSNVPGSTVQDCLSRAHAAGLSLVEIKVLSDDELEKKLFPAKSHNPEAQPLSDFREVQKELRKTGVTLALRDQGKGVEEWPAGAGGCGCSGGRNCIGWSAASATKDCIFRADRLYSK